MAPAQDFSGKPGSFCDLPVEHHSHDSSDYLTAYHL